MNAKHLQLASHACAGRNEVQKIVVHLREGLPPEALDNCAGKGGTETSSLPSTMPGAGVSNPCCTVMTAGVALTTVPLPTAFAAACAPAPTLQF